MKKTLCILILCIIAYASGCTYETVETALCDNPPTIELVSVADTECNASIGRIEVIGAGGLGDLEYSRDGLNFDSSPFFENLAAGIYEISVRDEKGCLASLEAEVKNSEGLNISVITSPSGCNLSSGSVVITATGGKLPYRFMVGDIASDNNQFNNLASGTYTASVRDATGCTVEREVSILTGQEFSTIKSIITASCATSNCHGGNISPDFRNDQNIIKNANNIAARTGNKTMPPAGPLSDNQIQSIACWAKDGSLAN
jgi:hypothetical protein